MTYCFSRQVLFSPAFDKHALNCPQYYLFAKNIAIFETFEKL